MQIPNAALCGGCVSLQFTGGITGAITCPSIVNRQALKWVPSEGPEKLLVRDQGLSRVCNFRIAADPPLSLTLVKNDPLSCDTVIWVFTTKALQWVLFYQKIRNKPSGGGREKLKCNRSPRFALRWMVGLSYYSPSTDMLPRVSWQLVKINHNQDGCCHCHTESMGLVADRVWEQGPHWCKGREKGGPGERKTEEKQ